MRPVWILSFLLLGPALLAAQAPVGQSEPTSQASAVVSHERCDSFLPGRPCIVPCHPQEEYLCVWEIKKNARTVYRCKERVICLPVCGCSLWELGEKCFGGGDCGSCGLSPPCACGRVKRVNVLIKKSVPAGDTLICAPKKLADLVKKQGGEPARK
jgi:hypothetical protein